MLGWDAYEMRSNGRSKEEDMSDRRARGVIALVSALALGTLASGEHAAEAQSTSGTAGAAKAGPGLVVAETSQITAKVDAVDLDKRRVTVTGPRGNTVTLKVGPAVKNLDQVKPGDQLIVRYLESVALFVRRSGEPPAAVEAAAVEVVPKGQRPAATVVDTVEITGTVEAIDHAKRTVTLKGPQGNTRTIKVDPSDKRFKDVKKGDQVVARFTEALAISVKKS